MTVQNRRWPAAASTAVLDVLTGAPRRAEVIASLRHALLLAVAGGDRTRVLAVVTSDAALVANGIRIAEPASNRPFDDVGAGRLEVGEGRLQLPRATVTIARWWDARVPYIRPDAGAVARLAHRAASGNGLDAAGVLALDALDTASPRALDAEHTAAGADEWAAAATSLIGRGPGLTPAGDDVLAGVLVGLHAVGRGALARRLGARIDGDLASGTTAFSAELVRLAAAGYAAGEVLRVVRALHEPSAATDLDRAVGGLLSVGHTSGADLATGLALALASTRQPPTGPRRATDLPVGGPSSGHERRDVMDGGAT